MYTAPSKEWAEKVLLAFNNQQVLRPMFYHSYPERLRWKCTECHVTNESKWSNLPGWVVSERCGQCNTRNQLTLPANASLKVHWYLYYLEALEAAIFEPIGEYLGKLAEAFGYTFECDCEY